jgi:hypothetical protein
MHLAAERANAIYSQALTSLRTSPLWSRKAAPWVAGFGLLCLLLGMLLGAAMTSQSPEGSSLIEAKREARLKSEEAERLRIRNRQLEVVVEVLRKRRAMKVPK